MVSYFVAVAADRSGRNASARELCAWLLDFAAKIVDTGRLNFGNFPSQSLTCVHPPLEYHVFSASL